MVRSSLRETSAGTCRRAESFIAAAAIATRNRKIAVRMATAIAASASALMVEALMVEAAVQHRTLATTRPRPNLTPATDTTINPLAAERSTSMPAPGE
jgi:hypothetical protein